MTKMARLVDMVPGLVYTEQGYAYKRPDHITIFVVSNDFDNEVAAFIHEQDAKDFIAEATADGEHYVGEDVFKQYYVKAISLYNSAV